MIKKFSIVTITKNNELDLIRTIESISPLLNLGAKLIIINGGEKLSVLNKGNYTIINEPDTGIYNALNKGIQKINTKYMMFLHSGDELIKENLYKIEEILSDLENNKIDISLNSVKIQYNSFTRNYKSDNWKKKMIYFGVQPPHLPIIYRSKIMSENTFSEEYKIISDFLQLEKLIFNDKITLTKHNYMLVKMKSGGKSTNGLKSYFEISKEFYYAKGFFKTLMIFFSRYLFKIYLMR